MIIAKSDAKIMLKQCISNIINTNPSNDSVDAKNPRIPESVPNNAVEY